MSEGQPGRTFLTLVFTDLNDSSALAGLLQFEEFATLLERVRAAIGSAVERHGGQLVRTQGDGSLAVFGHPLAGEHDARHACQAALEAHAEVASWPPLRLPGGPKRLSLHSGLHAGLAYVALGDIARGRLDIVGDAANTAARLASLSARGEILADAESLGPELAFFETSPERVLALPGRAVPVRAVTVTGLAASTRRIDLSHARGLSPLLGRAELLREMLAAFDAGTALLEIRGPAGIGKTRLLDEFAEQLAARGAHCLRGACETYGGVPVLAPFRQVLAAAGLGAEAVRERMLALATDVTAAGAAPAGAVVLLLDDWQWADDASRALLAELHAGAMPLRIVTATRPTEELQQAPPGQALFTLAPLTPAQTRVIVDVRVPGTSPFLVDELHAYAGGVPLLVEEMCHTLRQRGEAGWGALHASGPRTGAGSWMKSMMAARLMRLPPPLLALAQAAAVLGLRAPRALLERLAPEAADAQALHALAEEDLLFADGEHFVSFRHGLSRDAVYELMPLARRVALHRQVLALLQADEAHAADERLDALAHHTHAAGDWRLATGFAEAAGDSASRQGAYDKARRHYMAAIEAAECLGLDEPGGGLRWCSLVHRLGMTCMFDALALPEVMPLVERCTATARALGDPQNLALSLYWQSYLAYAFGEPRRAARLAREVLSLARTLGNTRLTAQIEATLSQALAACCAYPEAQALMERALQAKQAQSQRSGAVAIGSAFTLACHASVLGDQGHFDRAHEALERARALIAAHPTHPVANSVRNWEMVVLAWQGRWDQACAVVDETVGLARRSRALLPLAIAHAVGGYARWSREREPAAMQALEQAVRWMESRRVPFFTTIYYGWLVEMCVAEGRPAEAHAWAGKLLQRSRAGERLGEAAAWRALAAAALSTGDLARARLRLRRAEAAAGRRQSERELALNDLFRAELLRAEARGDEAAALAATARARLLSMGVAAPGLRP